MVIKLAHQALDPKVNDSSHGIPVFVSLDKIRNFGPYTGSPH